MRIAVLDDDATQAGAVERMLVAVGHACETFTNGGALILALRRETFDALILDWNLPDITGLEVMAWVREHMESPPPILLLTARTEEGDIVAGLNAGADDYMVKPVQAAVLLARVNAVCRRTYPATGAQPIETYGAYAFDTLAEIVTVAGHDVQSLTSKEFCLALLFFRNIHRALSRAYILEAVWDCSPNVLTRTLDMHVSRIRTKLYLRPENGFRLAPVYSYGYRLERLASAADAGGDAAMASDPL